MQIVKLIQLNDNTQHQSKTLAERHLMNTLSSGEHLRTFEDMAHLSALTMKSYFIDHSEQLKKTLLIVDELKEIDKLKDF